MYHLWSGCGIVSLLSCYFHSQLFVTRVLILFPKSHNLEGIYSLNIMSVKLRKKSNKDGTTSLYLDIYHDGNRRYEFLLPSANGANKTLRAMVRRAGIDKYITWHCLRHSFGTNLVYVGTDISVVGDLMGHSSLKHTPRYIKASNELKERATNKLNINL